MNNEKGLAEVTRRTPTPTEMRERVNCTIKVDPTVDIVLRGKMHQLEFTNRAILNILRETGVNLLVDSFGERGEYLRDPVKLSHFLHQALLGGWPELTYDESLNLYSARHTLYVWSKLGEALSFIQPEVPAGEIMQSPVPVLIETPIKERIVNGLDTTPLAKS